MSKQRPIRWKQSDDEALKKAVRNFNDKIKRIEKKNPKLKAALPEKMTVKQLKESIYSRNDLKRELRALSRFTDRKNVIKQNDDGTFEGVVHVPNTDNNLKITKWQMSQMKRRHKRINKERERKREEIKNIEMTDRGRKLGYRKGEMGPIQKAELQDIKLFTEKMNYEELRRKARVIWKESKSDYWVWRDELLRQNYIDSITLNYNRSDEKDQVEKIIAKIQSMDFKEFRKVFEAEGGNFELSYAKMEEQRKSYLTRLESIWTPQR